jgi:hypothetical protein
MPEFGEPAAAFVDKVRAACGDLPEVHEAPACRIVGDRDRHFGSVPRDSAESFTNNA